jgi:predicted DNA-binding transcriptional regulator AlpA
MTKPKTLDLVGLGEAAATLGITSRQMLGWTRRDGFPEPIANLNSVVWHRGDIERWSRDRQTPPPPG